MADTVNDLIERTRRHLFGFHRSQIDRLDTTIDDDDTEVVLEFNTQGLGSGALLSIDDELMFVWSVNPTTKTATIERGYLGTEADDHTAGAIIDVNPRFPRVAIREELRREISSWPPSLFSVETLELDGSSTDRGLDLDGADELLHVLRVVRSPRTSETSWFPIDFRLERNLDQSDYPSGSALFFDKPFEKSVFLRVSVAVPFSTSTFDDTTTLGYLGIDDHLADIPVLGATWRLLATREIKRTMTEVQGEPRDAAEVPPGHIIQTAAQLKKLRDERIGDESRRLQHQWPTRF